MKIVVVAGLVAAASHVVDTDIPSNMEIEEAFDGRSPIQNYQEYDDLLNWLHPRGMGNSLPPTKSSVSPTCL